MSVSYHYARQFLGKPVCVHCRGGKKYYGIVREITVEGMWLEPIPYSGTLAKTNSRNEVDAVTADKPQSAKGEQVFFGLFWIPFLIALALIPLAFSPYFNRPYYYGRPFYGGYHGYYGY